MVGRPGMISVNPRVTLRLLTFEQVEQVGVAVEVVEVFEQAEVVEPA